MEYEEVKDSLDAADKTNDVDTAEALAKKYIQALSTDVPATSGKTSYSEIVTEYNKVAKWGEQTIAAYDAYGNSGSAPAAANMAQKRITDITTMYNDAADVMDLITALENAWTNYDANKSDDNLTALLAAFKNVTDKTYSTKKLGNTTSTDDQPWTLLGAADNTDWKTYKTAYDGANTAKSASDAAAANSALKSKGDALKTAYDAYTAAEGDEAKLAKEDDVVTALGNLTDANANDINSLAAPYVVDASFKTNYYDAAKKVFTDKADADIDAAVVVAKTVATNSTTVKAYSIDSLKAAVKQLVEDAIAAEVAKGDSSTIKNGSALEVTVTYSAQTWTNGTVGNSEQTNGTVTVTIGGTYKGIAGTTDTVLDASKIYVEYINAPAT
jgi:hypothetical protein